MAFGTLLMLLVVAALLMFWVFQFVQLMMLSDADFPGRYDKPIWAAFFLLVFFLAPLVFRSWKQAYLSLHAEAKRE